MLQIALLDEFEDKFGRQYRLWEEERANLMAQLDAARREARGGTRTRRSSGSASGGDSEDLVELREMLQEACEKEVSEQKRIATGWARRTCFTSAF